MNVEYRKAVKAFTIISNKTGNKDGYNVGDDALCLPNCHTDTHYCIGTDLHVPAWIEKEYLSDTPYKYTGVSYTSVINK